MKNLKNYLDETIWEALESVDEQILEIRMRIHAPLILELQKKELVLNHIIVEEKMLEDFLQKVTHYSLYAYEREIRNGYFTVEGGHRIGLAGEGIYEEKQLKGMKNIRFLNIRLCHPFIEWDSYLVEQMMEGKKIKNTLVISPPGYGKTTMLRYIIRTISHNRVGTSISVIDERNEIAGGFCGVPQIDLGPRTDVFSGVHKIEGIYRAVRSMGPELLAVDEIGTEKDLDVLQWALNSGVTVLATIHGKNVVQVQQKLGKKLAELFQCYVLITERGKYQCF